MNKFFAMMVALVATLFTVNALAWNPPPSPAPASWISDPSHVLSDSAHARLDAKLRQINQSSANEIAALVLPTLDGAAIEDVGDLTAKAWGVGKKNLDNGVLVVLAMKEHKSRISTGKGVEGDLPDLKCNDILQSMRPFLRSGNVEGALGYAFDTSSSLIANHRAEVAAGKANPTPVAPVTNSPTTTTSAPRSADCAVSGGVGAGSDDGGWLWVLGLLGLGLGGWWLAARAKARRDREEAESVAQWQRQQQQRRLDAERETARRAEEMRLQREALSKPTPMVEVPVFTRPTATATVSHEGVSAHATGHGAAAAAGGIAAVATGATIAAAVTAAAELEHKRREHQRREEERQAEASRQKRERDEEDARRRRREQDEEDARRRRRDEESSSSSSSSSSSYDSGSSWGGGSDSGGSGGFGGGDSGGGGSSSDW
jgi:uncharacterized protein